MTEFLKSFYIRVLFLFKKVCKADPEIRKIEEELNIERERRYLEKNIAYNLNSYRLINYREKYFGERCFIIGNGPSLRAEDLDKIQNEYSFAANNIFGIFEETEWRPSFYFVEDSLAYKNYYKKIKKLNCPKFVSSIALEWQKLPLVSNGIKFFDYLYYYDFYPKDPPLTVDLTKELWCTYNVGYTMLNAAIYMGFKEIYLLGMDFSYDFSGLEEILITDQNGQQRTKWVTVKKDSNHFSKGGWKIGEEVYITDTKYALKGFKLMKRESKNLGVKIFNATRGGKLEVFERIDLDKVERKNNDRK